MCNSTTLRQPKGYKSRTRADVSLGVPLHASGRGPRDYNMMQHRSSDSESVDLSALRVGLDTNG